MEATAGEIIVLVGENGSGKTTLAKLLAGLYHPDSGHIRWNGVDVSTVDPDELRWIREPSRTCSTASGRCNTLTEVPEPTLVLSKSRAVLRRTDDGRVSGGEFERGAVMSQYMMLLYAPEVDEAEEAERFAELPLWLELTESLREAGLLVANAPLHPVDTATTVRVRDGETEITDGPFAVTKEVLVGYYVLDCADLDEALRHAARLPTARHGSVEVRPIMNTSASPASGQVPAEQA
jgi:hypothetical protein